MFCRGKRFFAARRFEYAAYLLLFACSINVQAHELRPSVANISFEGEVARIELRLNLEAILAELGPEHSDSDDSPNATRYDQLRELDAASLEKELFSYAPVFQERIQLQTLNGNLVSPVVTAVEIPEKGDVKVARDSLLELSATFPQDSKSLTFQWDELYGPIILRAGENDSENAFSQYLNAGARSDEINIALPASRSRMDVVIDYLKLGYIHILPKGFDHILFVIGLFLLSARWRPILWQVSAFTIAHTITLALGVLGYITVPASIVEPLIALSISAVCIENLITTKVRAWRFYLVVGFGFLHGLGFAGVLGEIGLTKDALFTALISFNVGVELGQLSVILACFCLVGWFFRDKSWYRKWLTNPLSIVLAGIGIYLFAGRVFG